MEKREKEEASADLLVLYVRMRSTVLCFWKVEISSLKYQDLEEIINVFPCTEAKDGILD